MWRDLSDASAGAMPQKSFASSDLSRLVDQSEQRRIWHDISTVGALHRRTAEEATRYEAAVRKLRSRVPKLETHHAELKAEVTAVRDELSAAIRERQARESIGARLELRCVDELRKEETLQDEISKAEAELQRRSEHWTSSESEVAEFERWAVEAAELARQRYEDLDERVYAAKKAFIEADDQETSLGFELEQEVGKLGELLSEALRLRMTRIEERDTVDYLDERLKKADFLIQNEMHHVAGAEHKLEELEAMHEAHKFEVETAKHQANLVERQLREARKEFTVTQGRRLADETSLAALSGTADQYNPQPFQLGCSSMKSEDF